MMSSLASVVVGRCAEEMDIIDRWLQKDVHGGRHSKCNEGDSFLLLITMRRVVDFLLKIEFMIIKAAIATTIIDVLAILLALPCFCCHLGVLILCVAELNWLSAHFMARVEGVIVILYQFRCMSTASWNLCSKIPNSF